MKTTQVSKSLFATGCLVLALASTAYGQRRAGYGPGAHNYDPQTEVTISTAVQEVVQSTRKGVCTGTHLIVKTDAGTQEVHLGPTSYLDSQQFSFAKGDEIEVTGSKVVLQGNDVILARQIKKGGKTLVLRNAQGVPNWAGGGCQ